MLTFAVALAIAGAQFDEEKFQIETAKVNVAVKLRDPNSAVFSNVRFVTPKLVCGSVNAKNGYGGYTGFVPFAAYTLPKVDDKDPIVATQYDALFEVFIGYDDRMRRAVNELCRTD